MLVICGRPDLGEKYLARLVATDRHGADPIVRVLAVVRYPRQHALYWPEVAIEIPPVEVGCICRLHLYGRARRARVGRGGAAGLQGAGGPTSDRLTAATFSQEKALEPPAGGFRVIRRLLQGNGGKTLRLYAMSLERAQREALRRETGEAREIVRRQMAGEYRRQRAVLRMTRWEAAKYGA